MAHFSQVTPAPKRNIGYVPFVPLALDEFQGRNEKIVKLVELNHSGISEVARLAKVDLADAIQETYLLLIDHPQYIHCVQELKDELCCKLREYARPANDALARARSMTVIPSNHEDELDEALMKSTDKKIRRWREEYEPTDEQLDYLATVASKRPSGKKTALRVLKCIFSNAGYTCKEIAGDLDICLRRVQQIVNEIECILWSIK